MFSPVESLDSHLLVSPQHSHMYRWHNSFSAERICTLMCSISTYWKWFLRRTKVDHGQVDFTWFFHISISEPTSLWITFWSSTYINHNDCFSFYQVFKARIMLSNSLSPLTDEKLRFAISERETFTWLFSIFQYGWKLNQRESFFHVYLPIARNKFEIFIDQIMANLL